MKLCQLTELKITPPRQDPQYKYFENPLEAAFYIESNRFLRLHDYSLQNCYALKKKGAIYPLTHLDIESDFAISALKKNTVHRVSLKTHVNVQTLHASQPIYSTHLSLATRAEGSDTLMPLKIFILDDGRIMEVGSERTLESPNKAYRDIAPTINQALQKALLPDQARVAMYFTKRQEEFARLKNQQAMMNLGEFDNLSESDDSITPTLFA